MHLVVSSKDIIVLFCHCVANSLLTQLAPSLFLPPAHLDALSQHLLHSLDLFCRLLHSLALFSCFVLLLRFILSFAFFCLVLLAVEEISQKCVIHRIPSRFTCTIQQKLDSLVLFVWKRLRRMNS
jgi:hypothetical protein